jgi:hypothetical protein
MNGIISHFYRGMCRLITGESWANTDCVFVLSTGRSGTNTLADLIDLSPAVSAYHEPPPNLLKERQAAFHEISSNPGRYVRIFTRARAGLIAGTALKKMIYAETSARLTFFAPVISQICPSSRFIHLVRHPGDVVRSGMRRKWYEKNGRLDRYRIFPSPDDPFSRRWMTASAFEKICWYWNAYNSFALDFRATISQDRSLLVKAEDLFQGREETIEGLFEFIGVKPPSRDLVDGVLGGKLNRQVAGQFPMYEQWQENRHDELHSIAGETMTKLGYAKP